MRLARALKCPAQTPTRPRVVGRLHCSSAAGHLCTRADKQTSDMDISAAGLPRPHAAARRRPLITAGMKGHGETEDPRENSPTSAIIRHDSHTSTCENPGVTRPGIEPDSSRWEASRLTAQPNVAPQAIVTSSVTTGEMHDHLTQFIPNIRKIVLTNILDIDHFQFSHVGIVSGNATGRQVFSGISRFLHADILALLFYPPSPLKTSIEMAECFLVVFQAGTARCCSSLADGAVVLPRPPRASTDKTYSELMWVYLNPWLMEFVPDINPQCNSCGAQEIPSMNPVTSGLRPETFHNFARGNKFPAVPPSLATSSNNFPAPPSSPPLPSTPGLFSEKSGNFNPGRGAFSGVPRRLAALRGFLLPVGVNDPPNIDEDDVIGYVDCKRFKCLDYGAGKLRREEPRAAFQYPAHLHERLRALDCRNSPKTCLLDCAAGEAMTYKLLEACSMASISQGAQMETHGFWEIRSGIYKGEVGDRFSPVYCNNPTELVDRLHLLNALLVSGNNLHMNQIFSIVEAGRRSFY
ncbi:hypothetical protein PR048_032908 [Dryococelus australis]|uniref:Uncharacterized protein n=1 Tax=Dryococelus australis TaxID=614101 RepID=A0ABQ9G7P9_9NEOP|nr:hypothetical protein PR048_032908 [Dryococelus australis]